MTHKCVNILGIDFIHTSLQGFVQNITKRLEKKEKTFIVTANPEIVMHTLEDQDYRHAVQQADYVTADGIGVVKAAALLNEPLPERVAGFETMIELLKVANEKSLKIYLLGAKEEVLQQTIKNIKASYPNVHIVGSHNGFFDWSSEKIQNEIQQTGPDLIFVALGFPRQEKWISQNLDKFSKGVFMGVGGSFDVIAGSVKRAPLIWQKLNIEWLYRLVQQPTRWKRMIALPRFVLKVLHFKFTGRY